MRKWPRAIVLLATLASGLPATLQGQHRSRTHTDVTVVISSWQLDPRTVEFLSTTTWGATLRVTRHESTGVSFGGYVMRPPSPFSGPAPGLTAVGGQMTAELGSNFDSWEPRLAVTAGLGALNVDTGGSKVLSLRCDRDGRCDRLTGSYRGGWLALVGVDVDVALKLIGALELTVEVSARTPVRLFGSARAGAIIIPGIAFGFTIGR